MKQLKYAILPALTAIFFAACSTEQGPSQSELDSQVATKVKAAQDQLKAECDNRINTAAQLQADSLIAIAAKNSNNPKVAATPAPKPVTPAAPPKTKTKVKEVVKTPPPSNTKNDRFTGDGKPKETADETKTKNNRFEAPKEDGKKEETPTDTKRKNDRFK
jgi:hypothetical protein